MALWVQGFGCRVVSGLSSVVVGVSSLGSRDLLVVGESTLGFGALGFARFHKCPCGNP